MNEYGQKRPIFSGPPNRAAQAARNPLLQSSEAFNELKFRLHQRLIEELDPSKLEGGDVHKARDVVEAAARALIASEMPGVVGDGPCAEIGRCEPAVARGQLDQLGDPPGIHRAMRQPVRDVLARKLGRTRFVVTGAGVVDRIVVKHRQRCFARLRPTGA